MNGLTDKIAVITGDIKEASAIFKKASFDAVTCNPPYMIGEHGLKNPDDAKSIARHEIKCTFEDVAREAAAVHKACGESFLTITPGIRFADGEVGDQKRVMTPAAAKEAGSDYIVVGRPITAAADPVAAYRRCCADFL